MIQAKEPHENIKLTTDIPQYHRFTSGGKPGSQKERLILNIEIKSPHPTCRLDCLRPNGLFGRSVPAWLVRHSTNQFK